MGVWKHKLSDIDKEKRTATCATCGDVSIKFKKPNRWVCRIADRQWNTRDRPPILQRITKDACEICQSTSRLVPDHNHKTGKYRGTLCSNHNVGLGMFQDDVIFLANAIEYLQRTA